MKGLTNKTVLVTGGTSGIGQAIAVRFAEEGARVAINYRRDVDSAAETDERIHRADALHRRRPDALPRLSHGLVFGMNRSLFQTTDGTPVPTLTAPQMREVDRIAVEDFGLGILQMMENAGRSLAQNAVEMLGRACGPVAVLAGSGGNGGGGLCCARHLHNRGVEVRVVLSKAPEELRGAARAQLEVLRSSGVEPVAADQASAVLASAELTVDALVGYSLRGAPRGRVAALIEATNRHSRRTLSLDVPSGLDATSGQTPGAVVRPERTLTLALPKTGLVRAPGALYLADIGIPPEVYAPLGISFVPFFGDRYYIPLHTVAH